MIAAALFLIADQVEGSNRPERFWVFGLLGLLGWTLLEYGLHRFVLHDATGKHPGSGWRWSIHLHHHAEPRQADGILVRPVFSVLVSLLLLFLLWLLTSSLWTTAAVMTGLWAGFLYYESVHYRLHTSKRSGILLSRQRRWHFYHHFVDGKRCFGVTSPVWDLVFATQRSSKGGRV